MQTILLNWYCEVAIFCKVCGDFFVIFRRDDCGGRWAETNRDELRQHNSSLEFKLHRLRFIEYIERGACGQSDAVQYAKNFAPFAAAHSKGLLSVTFLHLASHLWSVKI